MFFLLLLIKGDPNMVLFLLMNSRLDIDAKRTDGNNALFYSVMGENLEVHKTIFCYSEPPW